MHEEQRPRAVRPGPRWVRRVPTIDGGRSTVGAVFGQASSGVRSGSLEERCPEAESARDPAGSVARSDLCRDAALVCLPDLFRDEELDLELADAVHVRPPFPRGWSTGLVTELCACGRR